MNFISKRILVVEDEEIIRISLVKLLERHHYKTEQAVSVKAALNTFNLNEFDLIISDLRLPGGSGAELIGAVGNVPVLIMTSFASLRSAVDIMRQGAADYISKPFDHEELISSVKRILDHESHGSVPITTTQAPLLGNSPETLNILNTIHKVAPTNAPVLLSGETGSGKQAIARAIHHASTLSDRLFTVINCVTVAENEIKHYIDLVTKQNDPASVFLRDLCQLPANLQDNILKLIKTSNVRVVASTTRDLNELSKIGLFREDLWLAINVIHIEVLPLRARPADIVQLTDYFLGQFSQQLNYAVTISKNGMHSLSQNTWPGNIKELKNTLYQAAILLEAGEQISPAMLGLDHQSGSPTQKQHQTSLAMSANGDDALSLTNYFTQFVLDTQATMSATILAEKLGISSKSLWQRRNKLGISRKTD